MSRVLLMGKQPWLMVPLFSLSMARTATSTVEHDQSGTVEAV